MEKPSQSSVGDVFKSFFKEQENNYLNYLHKLNLLFILFFAICVCINFIKY